MAQRAHEPVLAFHRDVSGACVARLRESLGSGTHLFDRQLRDRSWQTTLGTEDLTSTAICLVGLHRAGVPPKDLALDPRASLEAMPKALVAKDYPGAIGLVLWANALWDGAPAPELLSRARVSLEAPGVVRSFTTMETAWLVSGLIHERLRNDGPDVSGWLGAAVKELVSRYRPDARVFAHSSDDGPIAHRVRRWVANFADQIYSVQALSFHALRGGGSESRRIADACGARLVELQGDRGQWWWHYDARDGRVAQGYPVYSVHQHAMAPMALMALATAGGTDHRGPVEASHAWIAKNELGIDLLDKDAGTIWRDIERNENEIERVARHARSIAGLKPKDGGTQVRELKVNYETRPYEWAWCLYAGAIAVGDDRPGHVT